MSKRAIATSLLLSAALVAGCGDASTGVDARIDALFGKVTYGTLDHATARRLLDVPVESDGPFHVVAYKRYRARAAYADGRDIASTGAAADALYRSLVQPILDAIGARTIYVGNVEKALIDDDGAAWNVVEDVLYPSRAQFVALHERDDFRDAAVHEAAAVERGIVLIATALASPFPDDIRRVDLAALPFPPTPDDPPVTVVHLLDFNDVALYADGRASTLTGREALDLYEKARTPQAFPLGVRPGIKLAVEGQLIGDGRPWEEVRINNFPSRAAFRQLVSAESLDQAGYENREAALADTYAVLAAPLVNLVGYLE